MSESIHVKLNQANLIEGGCETESPELALELWVSKQLIIDTYEAHLE